MAATVAILLSTWNGERFLAAQLDSLLTQSHQAWQLYWRDDGSTDRTRAIARAFGLGAGAGRFHEVAAGGRLGAAQSFFAVLRTALQAEPEAAAFAFADQDDVWLPDKLARGLAALTEAGPEPALYCARQVLVDANMAHIGLSPLLTVPPGFPTALAQNVATGCTLMLNPAAARLVAGSEVPDGSMHDWWCYLVITAAGGRVIADDEPVVLYRQHPRNAIGAPLSRVTRAKAAVRRGPGAFMTLFRSHVAALRAQPRLLSPRARAQLDELEAALRGGPLRRLHALRLPGLRRQTASETMLFRLWFLLG